MLLTANMIAEAYRSGTMKNIIGRGIEKKNFTMTILTRNAITGVILGLVIPNIPQILEMVCSFLKLNIDLGFLKISTHMPAVYLASNDLFSLLPCFAVLSGYLILSVAAGFRLLKYQDIK